MNNQLIVEVTWRNTPYTNLTNQTSPAIEYLAPTGRIHSYNLVNRPSGEIVRLAILHETGVVSLVLMVEIVGPTLVGLVAVVLRAARGLLVLLGFRLGRGFAPGWLG